MILKVEYGFDVNLTSRGKKFCVNELQVGVSGDFETGASE